MRSFEPIAIVGRSCVLPGALDPEALFEAVRKGKVLIGPAPDRAWGLDAQRLLGDKPPGPEQEFVISDHGGYVTGFDQVFDAARFADKVEAPERLDRLTQWLLHCASGALEEAGVSEAPPGTGLIIGNLSYPTVEHTRFVEDYWLGAGENAPLPGRTGVTSDPRNRFSSGYPAHIVADAMGLTGDVFALDAACASSLYALELACRRLHNRESNLMLAGGIARADPLFIHLGFTALQALSPSAQSRPFHKSADGLLPAEGAGLVALKRVDDAVRDGDHIYGVIRGIGLSNDGRQSGFLAPAIQGQIQAMCAAYEQAGLKPQDVDFVECHATGTARGDSVELDSLASVWGDTTKPVIGSLKANIGHPITASGVASLLKVLKSFEAQVLPPTPCDDPLDAVTAHGFRVLSEEEPWPSDGPRRAAVSNFGFGGNNAHMIVEEWTGSADHLPTVTQSEDREPVVISAIGVIAGESLGLPAFTRRLTALVGAQSTVTDEIALDMKGLGFPPRDLQESLAQQTSILAVTAEALEQIPALNPHRTGVYVGMCVDPEVARHGLRVRLQELLSGEADVDTWRDANSKAARHLTAPGVLGCMPNIPANRLHTQRDWTSPGFTVASEELSGTEALNLAVMALQAGDIDAALVGASDFSNEGAHEAAARALFPEDRQTPGDAAVALVVMRESDAIAGDFPVIARLDDVEEAATEPAELSLVPEAGQSEVTARFGHAHGASGLLHVAAGAITAHLDIRLDKDGAWPDPRRPGGPRTRVRISSFSGRDATIDLSAPDAPSHLISPVDAPLCRFYSAEDRRSLATAVTADTQSYEGGSRLALIARDEGELDRLRRHAASELEAGRAPAAPGLEFGEGDLEGEVAFCYTGAAAAYPGAARDLLLAFPQIGHRLAERFGGTPELARDLYGAGITSFSPATQLTGSSFVCQAHTTFTRDILGIAPQVSMGLSSGETNSLMAFGVWNDLDQMLSEIETSEMYANQLTGEFRAAAKHWGLPEGEIPSWKCWRIAAPLEEVEAAIAEEPLVYLTVVHHYDDVVIGGETEACERVLEVLGRQRAMDLGLDMVVHCAPLAPFADSWREIHDRETNEVPDVRFYTNAGNRAYVPTREAAADAITQQALEPIDLPKTIEQAYEDGVRVFIEHGPRATVTGAIRHVLDGRPHLVVALDPHEGAGLGQVARAVARLWASGVQMDLALFANRMHDLCRGAIPQGMPDGTVLRLPVHSPDVLWPQATAKEPAMKPTPPPTAPTVQEQPGHMAPPPSTGWGYAMGQQFAGGAGHPTPPPAPPQSPPAAATVPAAAASLSGGAQPTGAVALFNSVAEAHAAFLDEQRETHQAFLELASQRGIRLGTEPNSITVLEDRAPDLRLVVSDVAAPTPSPVPRPVPVETPSLTAQLKTRETPAAPKKPAAADKPAVPGSPFGKPAPGPTPNLPEPGTVWLNRAQLETHSGGKISEIFGELFEKQDGYARQVRMPEPPLLFADRALTIEGEPGTMKKGRVVTETDVKPLGAWYLHGERMAPGVVIESGQADLLLISWLGADFLNQGDRMYRLLGCDLTFYGELPKAGETLTYDIYVDGHAKTGDVRLFFFHYDCRIGDRLLISVRNGQAGFFTDEELAGSGGVLWDAAEDDPKPDARMDPPPTLTTRRSLSAEELQHFIDGDAYRCFGEGFELAACHTDTPNIPSGRLQLLDHVPVFDPTGGPWGRGYLRAQSEVPVDAWFYEGHFKNDPCMPGTLMADAATQALSIAMAAMGFTIRRDGWRFEPVPEQVAKFLCRGQVIPDGPHTLEYEVFIEEVIDGDLPEVYAALLCKSDGFKVFGCRRFGMRLVPDYPITTRQEHLEGAEPPRIVGPSGDARGDYEALLACAWGKPSDAFGQMFAKYDGYLKSPRLPGPPYHFMSSVLSVDVAPNSASTGGTMVSTLELPEDAWYLEAGQGQMPFAVIVEALLQPCGWFSSYLNFFKDTPGDVAFRNLDGDDCIIHMPITPALGTLTFTTLLTRFVNAAGTSIVFFDVKCECERGLVMTLKTDFGFFSPELLEEQRGLPTTDEDRARMTGPSPTPSFSIMDADGPLDDVPGIVRGKMRMIDDVTGFWPEGGEAGLGRIRTYQKLSPDSWYFKAHFYEDPVQPGSLGLEAMVQSMRALAGLKGLLDGLDNPIWEQPALDFPLSWRYRGQVVPTRKEVVTEIEVLEAEIVEGESVTLKVYGTQWVDGLRIYEIPSFAIRVRSQAS